MHGQEDAFVILTPAFSVSAGDQWLPFQGSFLRTINEQAPELKVIVISFHYPASSEPHTTWDGNEVLLLGGEMRGGISTLRRWSKAWRELRRIKDRHRIVGILSMFCSESAFVGHYFAKRHGLGHKIWLLGQDARRSNKQVSRIRPEAGELVAISDFLVREFEASHGIRPAHLVPIGIRPEDFPPGDRLRPIHLIGAGTLSPIKQYPIFIDVVARLRTEIPEIRAVICGGGSELDRLRRQLAALDLGRHVELISGLSREGVLDLMQQSRVLLHPSSYEGFGMVCTEALYAGASVVSFVRPMDRPVPGWHVASGPAEMEAIAKRLLLDERAAYSPSLPFPMRDTVTRILGLFGYDAG